jgi:hypothetical protein
MAITAALLIFPFVDIFMTGQTCFVFKRPELAGRYSLLLVKLAKEHFTSDMTFFTFYLTVLTFKLVTFVLIRFMFECILLPFLRYRMTVFTLVGWKLIPMNFIRMTVITII